MQRRLLGVLAGFFLVVGSATAFGQCGDHIKYTFQTCGVHCGSAIAQTCEGEGTNCQDGTGDFGFGCCGLVVFLPGSCQFAKNKLPGEMLTTREFLAFQDALALRRRLLPARSDLMIASCGDNKNAFNDWLQARLKQRQ